MIIFERDYCDENLSDLSEHLMAAICDTSLELPADEYGFQRGSFTVHVVWEDEE